MTARGCSPAIACWARQSSKSRPPLSQCVPVSDALSMPTAISGSPGAEIPMSHKTSIDPVTLEVVRNYMQSAARHMRNVLVRASCNPVIYEMIDFSVGLYNRRADLLAEGPGIPHFMGTLRFAIQSVVKYVGESQLNEGDVLLTTY